MGKINKQFRATGRYLIAACIIVSLSACKIVKNEKQDPADANVKKEVEIYFSDKAFNPVKIVDDMWASKVLPYITQKATDFTTLKSRIDAGLESAGLEFGKKGNSERSPWTFITKGEATVLSVDLSSKAATAQLDVAPQDGSPDLVLQLGPVLRGSSLRDSLSFISFDAFANQIEFARISTAFNNRIKKEALNNLDREGLAGKRLYFEGVFSLREQTDAVVLTPVKLDLTEAGQ